MKKPRFSDQQIAFALQQAGTGTSMADVCRKLEISEATFNRWKERYGGLMPLAVHRYPCNSASIALNGPHTA